MERKKIILATNAALQTLLAIGFFLGLLLSNGRNEFEFLSVFCFFGFAIVQVLGALLIYVLYHKRQAKEYLKIFAIVQLCGNLLMFILGATGVVLLVSIAGLLFFLIWIIAPFFQAIWCFAFSWGYAMEEEKISEYV